MQEIQETFSQIPPDKIHCHGEYFSGSFYVLEPDGTTIREIDFTVKQPFPLTPFYYNKPITNESNPFNPPTEYKKDDKPREGVKPLALVRQALRPPNHLYEVDDAILCAVQNPQTQEWETRYFPQKSLDNLVWQEAMDLLNIRQ